MTVDAAAPARDDEPGGAWARFLAKSIDGLAVLLLIVVINMVIDISDTLFGTTLFLALTGGSGIMTGIINIAILIVVWIAYDVALLTRTGTTLGKKVMGLRVTEFGQLPSFGNALIRSALIWPLGLGLGLPLVSFATGIWGYSQVVDRGATIWDDNSGTQVLGRKIGILRWGLGWAAWVTSAGMSALSILSRAGL